MIGNPGQPWHLGVSISADMHTALAYPQVLVGYLCNEASSQDQKSFPGVAGDEGAAVPTTSTSSSIWASRASYQYGPIVAVRILFDYELPKSELARLQAMQCERDRIEWERGKRMSEHTERKMSKHWLKMEREDLRRRAARGHKSGKSKQKKAKKAKKAKMAKKAKKHQS